MPRPRGIALAAIITTGLGLGPALPSAHGADAPALRYIVTLRPSVADPVATAHAQLTGARSNAPQHVFQHALKGYVATLTESEALTLARRATVLAVELDGVVTLSATQSNPPWGLDRIDQRNRPLSNSYTYSSSGSGVDAYIIDSGIRGTHEEFGGRVEPGVNTVTSSPSTEDCNGHGTHVAGTVGGSTFGVAKSVNLIAVRVFGCSNSTPTSEIIAGVDWATGDHVAGQPAVANMSLGGGASSALDNAVRALIADGVSVSAAAGNGNSLGMAVNSCNRSPGRVSQAITVGATDRSDRKASFSNFGTCVDLHAPGVDITSAWTDGDSATNSISGTSMATPHVVGVAAQYLSVNPGATPAAVQSAIKSLSTKGIVTGTSGGLFGGSTPNNHLLFTNL